MYKLEELNHMLCMNNMYDSQPRQTFTYKGIDARTCTLKRGSVRAKREKCIDDYEFNVHPIVHPRSFR